jgi:Mce-associated membrane protein
MSTSPLTVAPANAAPARPARSPWSVVLVVMAVVLTAVTVGLAVTGVAHHRHLSALDQARTQAVAAGRQAIINLDAISAATLDADLKRVQAGSTGKFKQLFTTSEATLRDLYPKQKTTSSGTIRAAAVVSANLDTATLLIASDRSVTDATTTKPALQTSRWIVVMEKHGGHWLMADLEPVP